MMSELNDYKITNVDSIIKSDNDGKTKYNNDNPHYFQENSLSNQNENFCDNEISNLDNNEKTKNQNANNTNSTLNTSSTATSSMASSTSAISSSLGSIIGGVAASVATAVIVAVAFISILTINIALVMANTHSLVFQLEMVNAQKEDFMHHTYYAILKGDEYLQSQEIFMDSVYITFDDLQPGKEYTITIRNDEKVFVEKSYFTLEKDTQRAFVEVWNEKNTVSAFVNANELKFDECYVFTATDSLGKVLFKDTDIKQEKEYSFDIESSGTITFTLSINGKVCCFKQLEVQIDSTEEIIDIDNTHESEDIHQTDDKVDIDEIGDIEDTHESDDINDNTDDIHQHTYIPRGFVWEYNEQGQLVAFGEGVCSCEDVLRLSADITRDGDYIIASIIYNGTQYTDKIVGIDLTDKESVITDDNCYLIKATSFVLGNLDSENTNRYTNDENHPYIITGTADGILNCITIYNSGLNYENAGYRKNYYFEFNNLYLSADEKDNSTIFKLQTKYDVTIHIAIRGGTYFTTYNAPAFIIENNGNNNVTVTFDITYLDDNGRFTCFDDYNEKISFYEAEGADVIFNINGDRYNSNGEMY